MTRLGPCPLCDAEGPWENAAARVAHIRAHHTTDCDLCGQPVNASGLDAHMRYMHADEPAPEPEAAQPAAPAEPVDQDPEPDPPAPDPEPAAPPMVRIVDEESLEGDCEDAPDPGEWCSHTRLVPVAEAGDLTPVEQVEEPASDDVDVVHPGDEAQVTEPEQVEEPGPSPELVCPECGAGPFANRQKLSVHMPSHRTVTCDVCGKVTKANGIGRHRATHQQADRPQATEPPPPPAPAPEPAPTPRVNPSAEVECPECGASVRARGLGSHIAAHRRDATRAAAAAQAPRRTLAEVLTAMLPGAAGYLVDRIVQFIEQAKEPPAPGLWVVVPLNGTSPWLCRTAVVGHTAAREHAAAIVVPVDDIAAELNRPHLKVVS